MSFSLVAHTKAVGALASTTFTTPGINTTGACVIVIGVGANFSGTAGTLSDSKGNTWVPLTAHDRSTANSNQLYYCLNPTVGAGHTFTITSGQMGSITVQAFSETTSSVFFERESGATGVATVGTCQPGSLTPTNSNSLWILCNTAQSGICGNTSVNSGFTTNDIASGTGVNEQISTYLIQGAAAALNPTVTLSTATCPFAVGMAIFTNVSANQTIPVPVGSLAITSYAPGVSVGIPVPVATLAVTTYAPGLTLSIPVPAGALAFTTYAPSLNADIPVPAASMAFTAYVPRVSTEIPVPVGTLVIASFVPGVTLSTSILVPAATLTLTTFAPFISSISIEIPTRALVLTTFAPQVFEPQTIPVPKGTLTLTTYAPRVFTGDLTPCSERFGPKLYYWEPSYLERPEDTFLRATDWENGGHQGLKFVQGLIIEADTEGVDRQILLQGDQTDIETITINHSGQVMKPYSLNQPVQKHLLRLWPQDSDPWRLFGVRWVFEPAPEFAKEWKTQGTDHDIPGYQFLKDGYIAHCSTADITLNITVDDVVFSYVIPNSSGEYIKSYILFAIANSGLSLKGKLFTYELTSTVPFQLFQKDCEIRVHAWAGGDYMVKLPFGDEHRKAGARI